MKKSIITSIALAAIVIVLPHGSVRASESPTSTEVHTSASGEVSSSKPTNAPTESLTIRKQKMETSLDSIYGAFEGFSVRTQTTIDLLSIKNIDTSVAQADLDAAKASLSLAKLNLDTFKSMEVLQNDASEKNASTVVAAFTKVKTNLIDTRTHLLDSLTALKRSVADVIGTDH